MTGFGTRTFVTAAAVAASCALASGCAPSERRSASLTQDPLVMRLNKDEFRIAFGLNTVGCEASGCSGVIRYRVHWKTEDGAVITELKHVSYSVQPHSGRTITVDRQYFDTAEGAHTTEVVKVAVERITCTDGSLATTAQMAQNTRSP
jgi:hypothetical protein